MNETFDLSFFSTVPIGLLLNNPEFPAINRWAKFDSPYRGNILYGNPLMFVDSKFLHIIETKQYNFLHMQLTPPRTKYRRSRG